MLEGNINNMKGQMVKAKLRSPGSFTSYWIQYFREYPDSGQNQRDSAYKAISKLNELMNDGIIVEDQSFLDCLINFYADRKMVSMRVNAKGRSIHGG